MATAETASDLLLRAVEATARSELVVIPVTPTWADESWPVVSWPEDDPEGFLALALRVGAPALYAEFLTAEELAKELEVGPDTSAFADHLAGLQELGSATVQGSLGWPLGGVWHTWSVVMPVALAAGQAWGDAAAAEALRRARRSRLDDDDDLGAELVGSARRAALIQEILDDTGLAGVSTREEAMAIVQRHTGGDEYLARSYFWEVARKWGEPMIDPLAEQLGADAGFRRASNPTGRRQAAAAVLGGVWPWAVSERDVMERALHIADRDLAAQAHALDDGTLTQTKLAGRIGVTPGRLQRIKTAFPPPPVPDGPSY